MDYQQLINHYVAGAKSLRQAVAGLTAEQLDARPIAGKWSTRQVLCHVADFEPVYADRMKRVIAMDEPTFFGGDPDIFAGRLAYNERDMEEELQLVAAVRQQMARILRTLSDDDFQRIGHHSEDGPLTLETLLRRITEHIPHHIIFIEEKRKSLEAS